MKLPYIDTAMFLTALRTSGALIAGNGVVQLITGGSPRVVIELLVSGIVVIVLTSLGFKK
jgi:hypothetical protein